MYPKIVPVTEFRTKALQAVRQASELGWEFIITSKGKPAAILLNFDDWENILETLEVKSDSKLMKDIKKGSAYFKSGGKGIPYKEIDWD